MRAMSHCRPRGRFRTLLLLAACAACAPTAAAAPQEGGVARVGEPGVQPGWWRDGVCYEVFVRSFQDSDGDGIGDIRGLIDRLDYINDGDPATDGDLGATCVWLMPIMPSPSYHGYDVTNYFDVNRDYGTLAEFRELVDAAHARGIHVLIDMVLNHLSSEHPYFLDALLDADSPYRDWFVWSSTPKPAPGWSAPVWHDVPGRDEYYYGLFWAGMPDYRLDNPEVKAEFERVARFWLEDVGVDGFRIDAVGHFFEGPGGAWKHGPGTHAWLREYAAMVGRVAPDAFTVGEVWDSIGEILPYYPDQLTAYFMFEIADAIVEAVNTGSAQRLVTAVERVQQEVPDGRWGIFLRNHDQTRTMTDLAGDAARARLAASIMLTLPGVPFVYYGEEIGMSGSKSDGDPRLRTPMAWTRTRGVGFTDGVPWHPLHADSFRANVEAQTADSASLLSHYRHLIRLRTGSATLARGTFVPLQAGGEVLAYVRHHDGVAALVVANLGGSAVEQVEVVGGRIPVRASAWSAVDMRDGTVAGRLTTDGAGLRGRIGPLGPREARILELRPR